MDFDLDQLFSLSTTSLLYGLFALLLLYYLLSWRPTRSTINNNKLSARQQQPPEPVGSWPIIGHLHLLMNRQNLPHIALAAMADKYGPAFTIRIGSRPALVVSSWEVAKECFTTNDKVFASRPHQVSMKHMAYDYVMFGFAPYGPYWREIRKIISREVLSNSRLELLKHVWDSEINTSIKELYKLWAKTNDGSGGPALVEMKSWFGDLTLNIIIKMVAGKRCFGANSSTERDQAGRCHKRMRDFFKLLGQFVVADVVPYLGWLDLGGYEREMKNSARELDCLMEEWLEEHKRKRLLSGEEARREQDFMDVMLSILGDDAKLSGYFEADTINKSTCLGLILGGSDTTMASLVWALALLVNHPHVLEKAQNELDIHVDMEKQVDDSDIHKLVYLQAIVKESIRLYGAIPLTGLRESSEDCTVAGYHVAAGTRLIINTWKIHRDPRVWSNPSEFQPDRFLTTNVDIDIRGQNFQLIPFGTGRRACPGISLGVQVLHLALARLIHGFDFKTPTGAPTDMTGSPGLTNVKATPLDVLITPRLPSRLYGC